MIHWQPLVGHKSAAAALFPVSACYQPPAGVFGKCVQSGNERSAAQRFPRLPNPRLGDSGDTARRDIKLPLGRTRGGPRAAPGTGGCPRWEPKAQVCLPGAAPYPADKAPSYLCTPEPQRSNRTLFKRDLAMIPLETAFIAEAARAGCPAGLNAPRSCAAAERRSGAEAAPRLSP